MSSLSVDTCHKTMSTLFYDGFELIKYHFSFTFVKVEYKLCNDYVTFTFNDFWKDYDIYLYLEYNIDQLLQYFPHIKTAASRAALLTALSK